MHSPKILPGEGENELKYIDEKAPIKFSIKCGLRGLGFHPVGFWQIVLKPERDKDGEKSIDQKCVQNPSRSISIAIAKSIAFLLHFTCSRQKLYFLEGRFKDSQIPTADFHYLSVQ